jgi:hypothetical protein
MSNPSTPTAASVSGRPAVPPQSRTLGRAEPNPVNPRFNAVHSPAEYVKELARYNEAKDRASFNAAIEALRKKRSHHGNGNGNYNDSNLDADADPDASAQQQSNRTTCVACLYCSLSIFVLRPNPLGDHISSKDKATEKRAFSPTNGISMLGHHPTLFCK